MIYIKTWETGEYPDQRYRYKGWFLFGFIPLLIVRTLISLR